MGEKFLHKGIKEWEYKKFKGKNKEKRSRDKYVSMKCMYKYMNV